MKRSIGISIKHIFRHWTPEQRPQYQQPYEHREATYQIMKKLKERARDHAYENGRDYRQLEFDWDTFYIDGDDASVCYYDREV